MERIFKTDENLYIYSMGKKLRITAIFTNNEDANKYMQNTNDGVIASFYPFIFLADIYDKGI